MNDVIKRQDAVNYVREYRHTNVSVETIINMIPSAKGCEYWDSESDFCSLHRPSAEKTGKWIPVSERLPDEEKGTYWVCTDTEYQYECRWTNVNHIWTELTTNWHWHIMDIPQYTKVIAWMPLPEPYKEANK